MSHKRISFIPISSLFTIDLVANLRYHEEGMALTTGAATQIGRLRTELAGLGTRRQAIKLMRNLFF